MSREDIEDELDLIDRLLAEMPRTRVLDRAVYEERRDQLLAELAADTKRQLLGRKAWN